MVRTFFHAATENMAALLRSVRLLKFSPSGLLQIAGTKRNGPPLGRLYSGAVGGRRTGVCSRQIGRGSENASSCAWPYAVGCVRNYTVATEKKNPSIAVQSKQAQDFDWAMAKLDSSLRRTGRITKTLLLRIFHDSCRAGYPSSNQALLLVRSCGSLLPEVPLEERTELAHRMWHKLQELGAKYDVSHYNALLKVYLQNEFKFSPTDFLAKIEAANVEPNRVTYQRLIAAYCQNGDLEGASTILGFMKSKDLPITEAVFTSLVTGHARAGDIESAENILPVMHRAGVEPGPYTYVALLDAYVEKGDNDGIKKTLEVAESADCTLMNRDIMHVIFTMAKAGHHQLIPEMIARMRNERSYIPDSMNLCLSLITQGQEDTAFLILKSEDMQFGASNDSSDSSLGSFFLKHCINMGTPVEKIVHYCKELQESNLHSTPLSFALFCALQAKKTDMSLKLMKVYQEQNLPIRPHFFWPLLVQPVKKNNREGVIEVMKMMKELGVPIDSLTLSNYILHAFPSHEAASESFKEAGISMEPEDILYSQIYSMATTNLAKLYNLLSDPSFPSVDRSRFIITLVKGFSRSSDVENMVKITNLLFKDTRFFNNDTSSDENAGFLLYSLINSMTEEMMKTQKNKLRRFFNQLQKQNIKISLNIFRGIQKLLDSLNAQDLIKDVRALHDPEDNVIRKTGRMVMQEKKLAQLKAENKPLETTLNKAIHSLIAEQHLQHALELKQQYEAEMSFGTYALLIKLCCHYNNVEEALNLKREMNGKDPSVVLDPSKYLSLVKVLIVNDRLEEAVEILKEMKEKDIVMSDGHVSLLFHTLTIAGEKGGVPAVRMLLDTIFTLGLAKPTNSLCSPIIALYLNSGDLPGAVKEAQQCQKRYGVLPHIHDMLIALVEKGDTDLLQKVMDFVSQEQGEMSALYDLFFAFLQTGRYRDARKITETPGLRAKPRRLQWFAEKCIMSDQMEHLENMVDSTAKLFECDRDEMYSYVLRLCLKRNDWQKAEATWTKMQEENVIPRERTLRLLSDVLKTNGRQVQFEMAETWDEEPCAQQEVRPETPHPQTKRLHEYHSQVWSLCRKGDVTEAYALVKSTDETGVVLSPRCYDHVIRALFSQGLHEEAMDIKKIAESCFPEFKMSTIATNMLIITQSKKGQAEAAFETFKSMVQSDYLPSQLSVSRLVQALSNHGDVARIQELELLMKDLGATCNLPNMIFVNGIAIAHIKNGDVESAVDMLESFYTNTDNKQRSMSIIFRTVMEDGNEQALDKLSAMAERLVNHFNCYRPAVNLFTNLLNMDKVEDAKFMLARCGGLAEQKSMLLSFVAEVSQKPGEVHKIKNLLSLVPDFTEKEVQYCYLMKCHVLDEDLPAAKALHEQAEKEGIVLDKLTLKRLAQLYHKAGETVPFPEPPESFKFYAKELKEKGTKLSATAEE